MWQLCEVLLKLKGYVIPLHHPFHFSSTPKTAHRKLFNRSCLIIVSEDFLSRHHSYRSMENYSHFCGCTHSGAIKRDLYICWKDQHNEIMNAFRSLIPLPYFFSSILLENSSRNLPAHNYFFLLQLWETKTPFLILHALGCGWDGILVNGLLILWERKYYTQLQSRNPAFLLKT